MKVAYQFFDLPVDLRYQAHWHPKGTHPFPWFLYRHYHHLSSQRSPFSPLFSDKHKKKIRTNVMLLQAWQWLRCRFHPTYLWSRQQGLSRMSNAWTLCRLLACLRKVEKCRLSREHKPLLESRDLPKRTEACREMSDRSLHVCLAFCSISSLLAKELTVMIWVLPRRSLFTPSVFAAKTTLISTFVDFYVDFFPLEWPEWLPLIFLLEGLKPLWRSSSRFS